MIGVLHLKANEDAFLPPEQRYIRAVEEVTLDRSLEPDHEEEHGNAPFRMIICMNAESSRRLQQAQFLQSDTSFKRIVGFEEFEIGHLDPGSRTGKVHYFA